MSQDSPDSEIREFYEQLTPSNECIDDIFAMRDVVTNAKSWKRVAIGAIVVASIMTVACGILLSRQLANDTNESVAENQADAVERLEVETPEEFVEVVNKTETHDDTIDRRLRLVAFRRHRDRCDQCRGISENFVMLQKEFAEKPVAFVQLDFSDRPHLAETRQKSVELGVGDLFDSADHTGWILMNSNGDLLAMLEPESSFENLSVALNDQLTD
ncbi:hypothetical protein AB1L42_01120 [Thalassoglobus sp. JC818]|uniref:hypothetical protein n=1 Tax=Thalassoglobus sp. JC818 TaxID=3232136 RepID=UPI003457A31E